MINQTVWKHDEDANVKAGTVGDEATRLMDVGKRSEEEVVV